MMHKLTNEQALHAKKWIEELRSDKYLQTSGWLHIKGITQDSFCCLGIACLLSGMKSNEKRNEGYTVYTYDDSDVALPETMQNYYGLKTSTGGLFNLEESSSLAILNDAGRTFKEIAQIIENNLLDNRNQLFVE